MTLITRVATTLLVVLVLAGPTRTDIAPVFGPQSLSLSPRANGMGEAGVALVDQYAAYANPANLALYHIDRTAVISFSPVKQKILPDLADDYTMRSFGASVGMPVIEIADGRRLYAAAEYSHNRLKYSSILWEGIEEQDVSDAFTAAVALSGPVMIAAGGSYKRLTAERYEPAVGLLHEMATYHGDSWDFGFTVQYPVRLPGWADAADSTELRLTPTLAASWSNYGPDWPVYGEDFNLPQPRLRRIGTAVAVSRNSPDREWYHLLVTFETAKWLREDDGPTQKTGVELAVFEALAARIGSANAPRERWTTYGFGAHARGLMRLVFPHLYESSGGDTGWLTDLARRADIEADYSRVKPKDNLGFSGRWFFGVTASF